jgi:WhiB family redox-sensing transcriptional regulator
VNPVLLDHEALCAQIGGDAWFPESGGGTRDPKRVCARCPLRAPCLEYALENDEPGVWGGTSEAERRRMKRDRETATREAAA